MRAARPRFRSWLTRRPPGRQRVAAGTTSTRPSGDGQDHEGVIVQTAYAMRASDLTIWVKPGKRCPAGGVREPHDLFLDPLMAEHAASRHAAEREHTERAGAAERRDRCIAGGGGGC